MKGQRIGALSLNNSFWNFLCSYLLPLLAHPACVSLGLHEALSQSFSSPLQFPSNLQVTHRHRTPSLIWFCVELSRPNGTSARPLIKTSFIHHIPISWPNKTNKQTKKRLNAGTPDKQSRPFLEKTLNQHIILCSRVDLDDVIEAFRVICPLQGSIFAGAAQTRQREGGGVWVGCRRRKEGETAGEEICPEWPLLALQQVICHFYNSTLTGSPLRAATLRRTLHWFPFIVCALNPELNL